MQMRFFARTDPLTCEHTHFEMYFLVILPFDPALGEGGTLFYYIHTEIYTLKSRRVNFRSQTDVNQSNVAYRFSHM